MSVPTKVSKEIVPFQQEFPIECDVKNDPIGHPESEKKIRLRHPVLSGIRLRPKLPTPNPGFCCKVTELVLNGKLMQSFWWYV